MPTPFLSFPHQLFVTFYLLLPHLLLAFFIQPLLPFHSDTHSKWCPFTHTGSLLPVSCLLTSAQWSYPFLILESSDNACLSLAITSHAHILNPAWLQTHLSSEEKLLQQRV